MINCVFLGCYALTTYAKPMRPSLQENTAYQTHHNLPEYVKKLNINLPLLPQYQTSNKTNPKLPSETAIILASAKKAPRRNFLVLKRTKNAVLKAILKRKSYGLRYTQIW